jgi:hypothetical protein
MRLSSFFRHSRITAASAVTLLGSALPATLLGQGHAEKLLAQAPIWGANDGYKGYAFLPVTVHGKAATIVIDLNCTKCDLSLSNAALAKIGTTSPETAQTESLSIGGVTETNIPVQHIKNPNWSVSKPDSMPTVVGVAGVHFMQRFDLVYDYPHRRVQVYAIAKQPDDPSKAWLPAGFTPNDCGKMVMIPPGAATFTGMEMKLDGHPVTGALEMGPYIPKMNELAFKNLGLPENSPRVQAGQPGESDGGHVMIAHVSDVKMTIGTNTFGSWNNEVLQELDVQSLLPDNPPVMLLNLSMLRKVMLFNGMSSKQVCIAKP